MHIVFIVFHSWRHQVITWITVDLSSTRFCRTHLGPISQEVLKFSIRRTPLNNTRADSKSAPGQWETSLQSNAVSHWLGANLESALNTFIMYFVLQGTPRSSQPWCLWIHVGNHSAWDCHGNRGWSVCIHITESMIRSNEWKNPFIQT